MELALLRYGFALALAVLVMAVASPLIVFAVESRVYSPILTVNATVLRPVNNTHLLVRVTVSYRGTIPLHDVEVWLAGAKAHFGTVSGEAASRDVVVEASAFERLESFRIIFSLAGLYKFNLTVAGVAEK